MDFLTPIWTGTISGVASGFVLAFCFSVWRKRQERRERKDQVEYIATLIECAKKDILNSVDQIRFPDATEPEHPYDSAMRERIRATRHERFRIELASTLSQYCSRLTPAEKQELHGLFLMNHEVFPDTILSKEQIVGSFRRAESMTWLGLDSPESDYTPGMA